MTREQRKKELKINMHVAASVLMLIYMVLETFLKLLSYE